VTNIGKNTENRIGNKNRSRSYRDFIVAKNKNKKHITLKPINSSHHSESIKIPKPNVCHRCFL